MPDNFTLVKYSLKYGFYILGDFTMIFNYIRVSTVMQNTERQLKDVPCDRIYEEKISGKDTT